MDIYDYYASIEGEVKNNFIKYMIEHCGIAYPTFFYKMRERKWKRLELEVFNRYYKKIRDE